MFAKRCRGRIGGSDDPLTEVISGAGLSLLLRVLGATAQFGFSMVVARYYGAEGLGIYTLSLSNTVIASVLGRWGLDQAALKLIAIRANKREWALVEAIQIRALKLVMSISVGITLVLFVLAQWLAGHLYRDHASGMGVMLQVLVLGIVPFSGLNLIAECLRAVGKVAAYAMIQSILVATIAMAGLPLLDRFGLGLSSAAYAYVFACYATFLCALHAWRSFLHQQPAAIERGASSAENLLETATSMAWISIVGTLMSFSETLLLGLFRPADNIGIYSAALRLSLLMSFIIIAFNTVLAPKFAALIQSEKRSTVQKLARKTMVMMLVATIPVLIVFILFPGYTLLLFGHEFKQGSDALVILALAQWFNVATGPAGLLLMMGGHEKLLRKFTVYTWLTNAAAGLLLIPPYGAIGAACSASVGIVMLNILAILGVRKQMGIALIGFS
ncbi:MAG: oligosaccharide flippase family protein [Methylococcaceae bacterium]|nr:oligosaccharide flippase family protein [Methylococcaceae bacterium]